MFTQTDRLPAEILQEVLLFWSIFDTGGIYDGNKRFKSKIAILVFIYIVSVLLGVVKPSRICMPHLLFNITSVEELLSEKAIYQPGTLRKVYNISCIFFNVFFFSLLY